LFCFVSATILVNKDNSGSYSQNSAVVYTVCKRSFFRRSVQLSYSTLTCGDCPPWPADILHAILIGIFVNSWNCQLSLKPINTQFKI